MYRKMYLKTLEIDKKVQILALTDQSIKLYKVLFPVHRVVEILANRVAIISSFFFLFFFLFLEERF